MEEPHVRVYNHTSQYSTLDLLGTQVWAHSACLVPFPKPHSGKSLPPGENWEGISRKGNGFHNSEEVEVSILWTWERDKMASSSNNAL